MSLFFAALLTAQDYRALGTEPFWSVDLSDTAITWRPMTGAPLTVPRPRPVRANGETLYRTPRLQVAVRPGPCSDGMSDRSYPDHVRVTIDGRAYDGCGAPAANPLADTRWQVALVDGRTPDLPRPAAITFAADRLTGTACNRFDGGYTLARGTFAAGPLRTTRMACPGGGEAALLSALRRPLKLHRGGPDTLRLDDGRHSITLRRLR